MSPRLEIRPVADYRSPDYPGVPVPESFARARYAGSVLDRMRGGLARPLVVFGLYASLALGPARGDDPPDPVAREGEKEPTPQPGDVQLLSPAEIANLVCGLEQAAQEVELAVPGRVAGQMGHLTEEEGRAVLEALFAKNGLEVARDARVTLPGLEFTADGFDGARGVGFEFLGPADPAAWQFTPAEGDLPPEALREVELEKARRGRAILVLDGRNYSYNVRFMGNLPTKAEAVARLVEDVRRFLVWLAQEGRLSR